LAVISNANGTVREKLVRVGLAGYFEAILDSHEEGVEKPDPRIFEAAMARTGARPASSVYVGDMVCIDVEGARRAGMTPVLIDPGEAHREQAVPRIRGLGGLAACIDALARGGL
jgi:putative hydrolase of the HAD superfamily